MPKEAKVSHITNKATATQKLGVNLAKIVVKINGAGPVIVALDGDLGSGKTTLLQGFAMGLGVKDNVLSPTFVIFKKFKIWGHIPRFKYFYHFDCYRLKNAKDVLDLGLKEIISNPENIVAIEWPRCIKKVLPKNIIQINCKFLSKNRREIILSGIGLDGKIEKDGKR